MLHIREMRPEDIPLGLELCRLAGWNQVAADWRRLLALAPGGVFAAEHEGQACGTASTTCYGTRVAWIGMVLVHPERRRLGIGSALMAHGIGHLQAQGVEAIKLDATDQGRPVYLKLGFRDERPICRCAGPRPAGLAPAPRVRPIAPEDWPAVAAADLPAFGAGRLDLLRRLAADGASALLTAGGAARAYGFARPGRLASFLGPVVAHDVGAARTIVHTLLAGLPNGPVFWDLMPENAGARALAESLGFTVARRLTRMCLGETMHPGEVDRLYAAASFELG